MTDRTDTQKVMRYDAERIVDEVIQERVDKAIYQLIGKRVKEATESLYDYVDNVVADIKTPNSHRGEVRYFGGSSVQRPMNASDVNFNPPWAGAIASSVELALRVWVTPYQFGGVGDGSNDDTAALFLWLSAGSKRNLYLPSGTWTTTSDLVYNTVTLGSLVIAGAGPNAVIKCTGSSNKGLHITGTAGVTVNPVFIHDIGLLDGTSSGSSSLLHFDGIARWFASSIWVDGNNKASIGMLMTAAQQGQVSGGQIKGCTTGGRLEDNNGGAIRSNGIDWHGMTFSNTTTNFLIASQSGSGGADDCFFRANHLTNAAMQIDINGGVGMIVVSNNHIEPGTGNNGMIVRGTRTHILGNSFYGTSGTTDIELTGSAANECKIIGNLIDANIKIDTGVSNTVIAFNSTGGTLTDNGTNTVILQNHPFSGSIPDDKITGNINATGALYFGSSTATTNFIGLNRTNAGSILNSGIAAFDLFHDGTTLSMERYTGAGAVNGKFKLTTGGAIQSEDAAAIVNFSISGTGVGGVRDALTACNLIAVPAGGTAGKGIMFYSTSNFGVFGGSGPPTLSAGKGSWYLRSDGTATTSRAYVNTDGVSTWTFLTAGA